MRLPSFRVRTLMIAVSVAALLLWGGMMGSRSYNYYRLAREYGEKERGWRASAAESLLPKEFCSECTVYFAQLTRKYRYAMWHPWLGVAPDPHAPGYDLWVEQERREKQAARDRLQSQ